MSRTSQFLFLPTADEMDIVGTPVACMGPLHTIAIYISNFTGRVHIEASIVNAPTDADWFPVQDPIEYPRDHGGMGETAVHGITFRGNFLWLRARVERSYLLPPPSNPSAVYGIVDKILLND